MVHSYDDTKRPGWEGCSRTDLAALLPRWDELETAQRRELEEHALVCPSCGPALGLLARAEAWLRGQAPVDAGECPAAEDLYDYGGGPGATQLAEERRAAIAAHVAACFDCETLVGTLAGRPPSPVIFDAPAEEEEEPHRSRMRLLGPLLAAAAAVLATFLLWNESLAGGPARSLRFPEQQLFRGEPASSLLFPRDQVLATRDDVPWSDFLFEIAPEDGASRYLVTVDRHDGSAFDEGTRVAEIESPTALVTPTPGLTAELSPGHYTWEAWAVVDGLDISLGRRDFEIANDPELLDRLSDLAPGDPRTAESVLALLHARYPTDARAFARTLPPSDERDEYLSRTPGR
jgi:hypothetical protein